MLSWSAMLINQVHAYLPPISFESPGYVSGSTVGAAPGTGWSLLSGTASVSPLGTGFGGGQALKLESNPQQEPLLKREIVWNPAETVAFIDLQLKPAADPGGSDASFYVNGTQLAFQVQQGGTMGEIWVYHGGDGAANPAQWAKTVGTFALAGSGLNAASYSRITMRHDYQRNVWDLFIDGKLAAANLAFEGRGANLEELELYGSRIGDTLIDDLSADPVNMLFLDTDKDGLPDSFETANGSNPNLYDRDDIKPGTGESFLDHYMDSLWAGGLNASAPLPPSGGIPPLTILGGHQPVTSLKGSMSVGGDGASTYSIPIDIPKGTAGMEPKISLNYSSNGGNGIAGLGWSIGGLQSITRGAASTAKDEFAGTVNFDENDRFFFNGERLVCINGTYGQEDSVYSTEIDSFARITLKGGAQDDPASWWMVETKAGLIIELGGTTDSKVLAPSVGAPITWDVSKVSDTVGNYYAVSWQDTRTTDNRQLDNRRLQTISYTGNASLAPYCHLNFSYESRPDASFAYSPLGIRMENTLRLESIAVSTGSQTNHTYHLNYETSNQSSRSLLKYVYKQQADGSTTNPTVFNWDGLQSGDPRWAKVGSGTMPRYSGATYDANLATINSVISTNGNSIRLEGDVARYHPVPGDINVTTGTCLEFEFRGANLDNGAYLIPDTNTTWNSAGDFAIRIKNATAPAASFSPRREVVYTAGDNQWQTFRVAFQGDPSWWLNIASGTFPYLALINADNDITAGSGYAEFRNIRFGTAAELDANSVAPLAFQETFDVPRFTENGGASRGVQIVDLDSDGLPDLIDQKVKGWQWQGNELVPNPSFISGTVYRNTGSSFVTDPTLEPDPRHSLVNAGGTGDWITRYDLNGVPCDVNGDGQLDLFVTELRKGDPGATSTQSYKFFTLENGAWTEMTGYHPGFESQGHYAWGGGYPGVKQLTSKVLADMNRDGYPDLIVETYLYADLWSTSTSSLILPSSSKTVFLNLVHKGQGWVQDDSLAPPAPLRRATGLTTFDIGNRLIDVDGDGFQDMISSTVENPLSSNFVDTRQAWKFHPAKSLSESSSWVGPGTATTPQDKPEWWFPAAPYLAASGTYSPYSSPSPIPVDGNAPLIAYPDTQSKESGTAMLDVNGDGLADIVRAFSRKFYTTKYERSHSTWFNTGRETTAQSSRWLRDSSAYGSGYTLPVSLTTETLGEDQICHQFADLNGDGLVDILFSRDGTKMAGPDVDRVANSTDPFAGTNNGGFINTGMGWIQDTSWALPGDIRIGKKSTTQQAAVIADVNGDGFPDVIGNILSGGQPELWINQAKPEVINAITDGFGSELQVDYRRLNDPTPSLAFGTRTYQKSTAALPAGQAAVIDTRLVVSRYSELDGLGGRKYRSQRYGDLRYDRINETSLGFGWVEALDESNGQLSRTDNRRDFPFAGSPILTQTSVDLTAADIANMPPNSGTAYTPGRKNLSIETASYAELPSQTSVGGTIRRPVQTSSVLQHFDLDGTLKSETVTTQNLADFDAYGFVTKSTVGSLDGTSVVTDNTYTHTTTGGKWHLGRLNAATVTKSKAGLATSTKSSAFTYDAATGLLKSETVEPGDPLSVVTTYTHDLFGNVVTTSVAASGQARSATTTYDSTGRFVISESNQAGHTVTYTYDTGRALLTATMDSGGLTTYFTYDPFGTLILTHHPDGTKTGEITGYASNGSVPPAVKALIPGHDILFYRAKQSSGTPEGRVYLDALGRTLVTETTALIDATTTSSSRYAQVYSVTTYDSQGRQATASESFMAGESPNFSTVAYDLLSRVTATFRPGGACDCVLEQGSQMLGGQPVTYSKVENAAHQILERWEDEHGRMVQSKDPSGQTTVFSYDVEGRLLTVTLAGQTLLTNTWDKFGNKLAVSEMNSGASSSVYNGFGEVVSSTNAKGQVTSFTYDFLGRPLTITKPEGTFTTAYSSAYGVTLGKPTGITGPSGYAEAFTYDSLGRPLTTSKTQFGETFVTSSTYDALGRVSSSTDAGGLTVFSEYDPTYSFPLRQKLAPGTYEGAGTVLWEAGTYDSKGRTLTQTLAQGVTIASTYDPVRGDLTGLTSSRSGAYLQDKDYAWDSMGNLTSRTDNIAQRDETFGYDHLNRLTSSSVVSMPGATITTVPPPQTYSYDTKGNLTGKGSSATLTYANASRPHAVSSAIVKGFNRTYSYDAAGYVTSDSKRDYQWTSFGQLGQLTYAAAPELRDFTGGLVHSAGYVQCEFEFDASGNRARQVKERTAANDSREIEDTLYLGSYEREIHTTKASGGASPVLAKTVHRHTLGGGIIYTKVIGGSAPGVKLTNVLADHLGSTDCILTGTWNGSAFSAQTTEYQSFDAWGERRDATTNVSYRATDADPFRTSASDHDRGYTGHEQLDDSGLIHMNGRIYDPELGRFLSPDPVVQIPEYSQNFNRYSYVLNNPLNATDPSGFSFISKVFHKKMDFAKENWRTIVVIVVIVVVTIVSAGTLTAGAAGVGSAILGGTAAAAVTAAAGTWAVAAIGGAFLGSIAGGLTAALNGGDLGDILRGRAVGAISGAITSGALHSYGEAAAATSTGLDDVAHVVGHGVVGGAKNVALGGKFSDGFLSAAAGASAGWLGVNGLFRGTDGSWGVVGRTAISGAVGGTVSVIGGGKFANGAYTAAFQHLLNAESNALFGGKDNNSVVLDDEDIIALSAALESNEIALGQASQRFKPEGFLGMWEGEFLGNEYGIEFPNKGFGIGDIAGTSEMHSIFISTSGAVTYKYYLLAAGSVAISPGAVRHIFRRAAGHVAPSTMASQGRFIKLFKSIVIPANQNMGVVKSAQAVNAGVVGYSKSYKVGQVWATVRNGNIINAGVNRIGATR